MIRKDEVVITIKIKGSQIDGHVKSGDKERRLISLGGYPRSLGEMSRVVSHLYRSVHPQTPKTAFKVLPLEKVWRSDLKMWESKQKPYWVYEVFRDGKMKTKRSLWRKKMFSAEVFDESSISKIANMLKRSDQK